MPKGVFVNWVSKTCRTCGSEFTPRSGTQLSCSKDCKRKWARTNGSETTQAQYGLISGNWEKYYNRLRCQKHRTKLSLQALLGLHEVQKGRCALSGMEMTCRLEKGNRCQTNASIDRIDPKGPYTADNIQLVCAILNKFRIDTSVEDFINWCKKVSDHALRE